MHLYMHAHVHAGLAWAGPHEQEWPTHARSGATVACVRSVQGAPRSLKDDRRHRHAARSTECASFAELLITLRTAWLGFAAGALLAAPVVAFLDAPPAPAGAEDAPVGATTRTERAVPLAAAL